MHDLLWLVNGLEQISALNNSLTSVFFHIALIFVRYKKNVIKAATSELQSHFSSL